MAPKEVGRNGVTRDLCVEVQPLLGIVCEAVGLLRSMKAPH